MARKQSFSMQDQASGSLSSSEPEFLAVGKFRRPHGIRGEILLYVWTDSPEYLVPGMEVYVGEEHKPVHIRSVRWHHEDLLISFNEYHVREDVGVLRNQVLTVLARELPSLDQGEYYLHQLIGMQVMDDEKGTHLGVVEEIIETGANDVYVVRQNNGHELLLPAIDPVILDIDLDQNSMRVHLLPGLVNTGDE